MNKLLSTADAARRLNLTPATVRLLARRGTLPIAATTESGVRLFRAVDVERLAKARAEKVRRHGA